jgi:predicted RNase H-like nuclease
MDLKVVGVDGCKGGWVEIALQDGRFGSAGFRATLVDIAATHADAEVIAVDIPIGLPDASPRRADVEARRFLAGRASSVFSTPSRGALEALSYEAANTLSREKSGKGLSKQSYALAKRILEADVLVQTDPRVFEIHPEVSFRELAGEALPSKKAWEGQMRRRRLLERAGIVLPDDLGTASVVPSDDVLDAAVAAWSALRIARGEALTLPADPPIDGSGRKVAIWY